MICKAAEKRGTGEDCKDEDVAGGEAKESGVKRKASGGSKSDRNYNHHRLTLINQMKTQHGMSFADAQKA